MQLSIYDPAFILNAEVVVTTANVVLLLIMLAIYARSYCRIKSRFTLGLIMFASLLLLQAVTSTPCMHSITCTHRMCTVGPLTVIPDILQFMALLVLLYLSSE